MFTPELFQRYMETTTDSMIILDRGGIVRGVNPSFLRLLGYEEEEMVGAPLVKFIHPDDIRPCEIKNKEMHRCGTHTVSFVCRYLMKEGGFRWLTWSAFPMGDLGITFATGRDITEGKKNEQLLRIKTEKLEKVFHKNPIPMCIVDFDNFTFIDVNESLLRMTGYSREEIMHHKPSDFNMWVDPAFLNDAMSKFRIYKSITDLEVQFYNKDRESRTWIISAELLELGNTPCVLAVLYDVTEQHRMREELNRSERLRLAGQMAASITHEIRNPMTSVRGFIQLLMEKENAQHSRHFYQIILEELDRVNSIICNFLSLAQDRCVSVDRLDINQLLHTLNPLFTSDANMNGHQIQLDLDPMIPWVHFDEKEFRQLIFNLVRNGLEAMTQNGILSIATRVVEGRVQLSVRDEGIGIPEDYANRLFEPFFTTKDKGTGLGLSMCMSIVKKHGGTIEVNSVPGQGSTFTVVFA